MFLQMSPPSTGLTFSIYYTSMECYICHIRVVAGGPTFDDQDHEQRLAIKMIICFNERVVASQAETMRTDYGAIWTQFGGP